VALLRTIKRGRWLEAPAGKPGRAPGDALLDLQTRDNKLSVWVIEDDGSNLDEVVGSIALSREALSHLDYVTFELDMVAKLGLDVRESEGATPVLAANRWHREVVELSAEDVAELADDLFRRERARVREAEVKSIVAQLLGGAQVDVAQLDPNMFAALQKSNLLP